MQKCLILSFGPVPSPEQSKVEGGGLRCWGLAQGLHANNPDLAITVAYNEGYRQADFVDNYQGIQLATWNPASLADLIEGQDTVIVSYCMGELSTLTADLVKANQQLVLDCYVPIYVEISARQSADLDTEYAAFNVEINKWARVLRRGDVFLCANANQKRYYQGVLSALGRVNPVTYTDDFILEVPYGVYREKPVVTHKPITALLAGAKKPAPKRLLWFGAIYPWFDLRQLVEAVNEANKTVPVKLVIVGAKNPFNAHPDFVRAYDELIEYIDSNPASQANTVLQDWIEFSDRANWYLDSDLVILINKIGEENELAWRTRLVDYVWADLPILTNGGDPLGEELIAHNAAARLNSLEAHGMAKALTELLTDDKRLAEIKSNIKIVRQRLYWDTATKLLAKHITDHTRPQDIEKYGFLDAIQPNHHPRTVLRKATTKAKMLPGYYKKYGARNTAAALTTTLLNQKRRVGLRESGDARVVFVSHQLDNTGGPLVFMDLVADFRKQQPRVPVAFHTFNPADSKNIRRLNGYGIRPALHLSHDLGIDFHAGDTVVLNTVAYSKIFFQSLFDQLKKGVAKKLIWYVHEDEPELIFSKHDQQTIHELLAAGKIIMYTPAIRSTANYQKFFDDDRNIKIQYFRLSLPRDYHRVLKAADFDEIRFILPGMVGDGRKGQLPVFYALANFKREYYDKHPDKYRGFSLDFVGMGQDFYSRQIAKHADKTLGKHFKHHPPVSHDKSLELIRKANLTICYSLRECLPVFVYEGMGAGHPILRNDCSGIEEQLIEGENGLELDSHDFNKLSATFERILNKQTTSNAQLAAMSKRAVDITAKQEKQTYDSIISEIVTTFKA